MCPFNILYFSDQGENQGELDCQSLNNFEIPELASSIKYCKVLSITANRMVLG